MIDGDGRFRDEHMGESKKKDWRELCAAVASEGDSKKLELLLQELVRALDDRQESRSQRAMSISASGDFVPSIHVLKT